MHRSGNDPPYAGGLRVGAGVELPGPQQVQLSFEIPGRGEGPLELLALGGDKPRNLFPCGREVSPHLREQGIVGPSLARGSQTTKKLQPYSFPDPFYLPEKNCSDLTGGPDMSSTTCATVEVPDGNDAEPPGALGGLPQPGGELGFLKADVDRPVLSDDFISLLLDLLRLIRRERGGIQIQG